MTMTVSNLGFRYRLRRTPVLENVTFSIPPGLHCLIGENGAGKSTLMKILAGENPPGTRTGNFTVSQSQTMPVGWVPQHSPFDPYATVYGTLQTVAWLKGLERADAKTDIERVIEATHLQEYSKTLLKNLSGGTLRRTLIAAGLLGSPEIILLDEPTAGLDPKRRHDVLRILTNLRDYSSHLPTILMTTHVADDAKEAESIIFLADKTVRSHQSRDSFLEEFGSIDNAFLAL